MDEYLELKIFGTRNEKSHRKDDVELMRMNIQKSKLI
jgi:hypothetical protein